jgi:glycosyltransferase involved in cell wall biosynthesis
LKISVITPCFNSSSTIADTISSIDAQNYKDIEHVIVDGMSQDSTMELIARCPQPWRHVVSDNDDGIYDAMNKGFSLSTGDVVGFLNSDDFYATNSVISEIAKAFEDPDVMACYADLVYVDQKTALKTIRNWRSSTHRTGQFAKSWVPPHPTFYVRRSLFLNIGGFDTRFSLAADYLFMLRALEIECVKSIYIPQVWVKMRIGGASNKSIRNIVRQNFEIYDGSRLLGIRFNPFRFAIYKIWNRLNQFLPRAS